MKQPTLVSETQLPPPWTRRTVTPLHSPQPWHKIDISLAQWIWWTCWTCCRWPCAFVWVFSIKCKVTTKKITSHWMIWMYRCSFFVDGKKLDFRCVSLSFETLRCWKTDVRQWVITRGTWCKNRLCWTIFFRSETFTKTCEWLFG